MPGRDSTGPAGQGPRTGQGRGQGQSLGRGRMGGPQAAGPGGFCVCPKPDCDGRADHQPGTPCYEIDCPNCGTKMVRE